jgi:hypothetical protein
MRLSTVSNCYSDWFWLGLIWAHMGSYGAHSVSVCHKRVGVDRFDRCLFMISLVWHLARRPQRSRKPRGRKKQPRPAILRNVPPFLRLVWVANDSKNDAKESKRGRFERWKGIPYGLCSTMFNYLALIWYAFVFSWQMSYDMIIMIDSHHFVSICFQVKSNLAPLVKELMNGGSGLGRSAALIWLIELGMWIVCWVGWVQLSSEKRNSGGSEQSLLNVVLQQHVSCRGCGRMSSMRVDKKKWRVSRRFSKSTWLVILISTHNAAQPYASLYKDCQKHGTLAHLFPTLLSDFQESCQDVPRFVGICSGPARTRRTSLILLLSTAC